MPDVKHIHLLALLKNAVNQATDVRPMSVKQVAEIGIFRVTGHRLGARVKQCRPHRHP